jgi:nucleotide-binding universal stress UspA family protein
MRPVVIITRILFPVDFSDSSENLVPFVLTVAERFEAEIHLLYVARRLRYFTGMHVSPRVVLQFEREIEAGATKRMGEFKAKHFPDYPNLKSDVIPGVAAEQIISYCDRQKIDLVIMGTHGRKGADKIIFGSVVERVVQSGAVPVLVINPHKTAATKIPDHKPVKSA